MPAAATAEFSASSVAGGSGSSTLTVATTTQTPPGNYTLILSGISADGVRTHIATAPLVVLGTSGDVNGDGVADCGDLQLAKLAVGSKVGDLRYNPKADFNGDGFVDASDIAFIGQRVSSGTTCP